MLVLGRREQEKISIGENITVTVTRISGSRVSIGVDAPSDVKVVRTELKGSTAKPQDSSS
jgi:carbon storage regulator CsrA